MTNQVRTTVTHPFYQHSANRQDTLFTVREGVPFEQVLEQLQCFLKSAHASIEQSTLETDASHPASGQLWGALYLTEISLALSEACVKAIIKENQA